MTATMTHARLDYTDDQLLTLLDSAREAVRAGGEFRDRLEYEIIQRAQERNATTIFSDLYSAELVPSVTYDQTRLTPLLELLPEEGVRESFIAEHQETVTVPAKWKVQQAIKWAYKIGDTALGIIAAARMEGAPRVKLLAKAPVKGD